MRSRRAHSCFGRDQIHEVVQRGHFTACQDVRPAGSGRRLAAPAEPLDEIVDVGEVIVDPPAAEDDEPATRDSAEQFQQSPITWPVDARGTRDDDLEACVGGSGSGDRLTLHLGLLVHIAGSKRSILGGRRMLDVPVYTHSAAVHDAFRANGGSSLDDRTHGRRVDRAVSSLRQAGLPVDRSDVITTSMPRTA